MTPGSRRSKGQSGEREISDLLSARLGIPVSRNLDQVREGGADVMDVPGLCVEVKRQEQLAVGTWWKQVMRASYTSGRIPVLAYRQNKKQWQFCMCTNLLGMEGHGYFTMSKEQFLIWLDMYWEGLMRETPVDMNH